MGEIGRTTRRGFSGGMVGAAVAGPSLVKEAAAQALSGGGLSNGLAVNAVGYSLGGGSISTSASHLSWLRDRIKQLRGMSADERREQISQMGWDIDLAEVSTLRSVSDRHKMGMLAERRFERQRERELGRLVRELMGLEENA